MVTERPFVLLSCAMSVDGCLDSAGPGRLVLSAKSWLCYPGIDRRARDKRARQPEPIASINWTERFDDLLASICARDTDTPGRDDDGTTDPASPANTGGPRGAQDQPCDADGPGGAADRPCDSNDLRNVQHRPCNADGPGSPADQRCGSDGPGSHTRRSPGRRVRSDHPGAPAGPR